MIFEFMFLIKKVASNNSIIMRSRRTIHNNIRRPTVVVVVSFASGGFHNNTRKRIDSSAARSLTMNKILLPYQQLFRYHDGAKYSTTAENHRKCSTENRSIGELFQKMLKKHSVVGTANRVQGKQVHHRKYSTADRSPSAHDCGGLQFPKLFTRSVATNDRILLCPQFHYTKFSTVAKNRSAHVGRGGVAMTNTTKVGSGLAAANRILHKRFHHTKYGAVDNHQSANHDGVGGGKFPKFLRRSVVGTTTTDRMFHYHASTDCENHRSANDDDGGSDGNGDSSVVVEFPKLFCANCYLPLDENADDGENIVRCPSCSNRIYCSEHCQDRDRSVHDLFCGRSGEINVDYEIAPVNFADSNNKNLGRGLFAKRNFKKNETIMVERPLLTLPNNDNDNKGSTMIHNKNNKTGFRTTMIHNNNNNNKYPLSIIPKSAKSAFHAMLPYHGSIEEKMDRNAIDTTENDAGLFLVMALANHDCIGNADHMYLDDIDTRILVASCDIMKGEEIRHHYTDPFLPRKQRRKKLWNSYGINCNCPLCQSEHHLERQVNQAYEYREILEGLVDDDERCCEHMPVSLALGQELLHLYDTMDVPAVSTQLYMWVYFDLYRAAIMRKSTISEGIRYMKKAHDCFLQYTGSTTNGRRQLSQSKRIMELIESPQNHRDYLKCER